MVARHQQVGHLHRGHHVAQAPFERNAERGEISGVENGRHVELLGEPAGDLETEGVGVNVADVQDADLVAAQRAADLAAGRRIQVGHLIAQHPDPLTDVVDVVDMLPHRCEQRWRPLEGTFEPGLVERLGVVAAPGAPEEEGHRRHAGRRSGQRVGPTPPRNERAGQRPGQGRHHQGPPGERPQQGLEIVGDLGAKPVPGIVGLEDVLETVDTDLVDLACQRDRSRVCGGRDLPERREPKFGAAGAEVGPDRHTTRADLALRDGDGAERQQRRGRAEEGHEQIGESPAHTTHGPSPQRCRPRGVSATSLL
jgi:hypothetical protein